MGDMFKSFEERMNNSYRERMSGGGTEVPVPCPSCAEPHLKSKMHELVCGARIEALESQLTAAQQEIERLNSRIVGEEEWERRWRNQTQVNHALRDGLAAKEQELSEARELLSNAEGFVETEGNEDETLLISIRRFLTKRGWPMSALASQLAAIEEAREEGFKRGSAEAYERAAEVADTHDYTHNSGYRCCRGEVIAKEIHALAKERKQ